MQAPNSTTAATPDTQWGTPGIYNSPLDAAYGAQGLPASSGNFSSLSAQATAPGASLATPSAPPPDMSGNSDYANQMAAATFATMPNPFAQMPMSPMQQVLGPRRLNPGDAPGMDRRRGDMDVHGRMRRMGGLPPAPTPGGGPLPPPTPGPVPAPVPDPGSSPPPAAAPPTTPTFGDQTGDPARWAQYLQSGYYQGLDPNAQSALRATLGL